MESRLKGGLIRWGAWLAVVASLALAAPIGFLTVAPVGCVSCHAAQSPGILPDSSAHASADCVSCHVGATLNERMTFAYYQTFGMVVPVVSTHDTMASRVSDAACLSCHQLSEVTQSNGLRTRHAECSEGSSCVDCHSSVAHMGQIRWPTTYTMEACLRCHGVREVARDCDSCHVGKLSRAVPTSGTFPLTHGPKWRRTHGMGEMSTCGACHAGDFCTKCHGAGVPHTPRFVSVHGPVASSPDADCLGCHAKPFCDDCHGYEMPHPPSFTETHGELVPADGDDDKCRGCHDQTDCSHCHELHVHPGGSGRLPPERRDARL